MENLGEANTLKEFKLTYGKSDWKLEKINKNLKNEKYKSEKENSSKDKEKEGSEKKSKTKPKSKGMERQGGETMKKETLEKEVMEILKKQKRAEELVQQTKETSFPMMTLKKNLNNTGGR